MEYKSVCLSALLKACLAAPVERNLCISVSSGRLHHASLLLCSGPEWCLSLHSDLLLPTCSPGFRLCPLKCSVSSSSEAALDLTVHRGIRLLLTLTSPVNANTEHLVICSKVTVFICAHGCSVRHGSVGKIEAPDRKLSLLHV